MRVKPLSLCFSWRWHKRVNEGTVRAEVADLFELEMRAVLWAVHAAATALDDVCEQAVRAFRADDILRGYHLGLLQRTWNVNEKRHASGQPLVDIDTLNMDFLWNGQLRGVDIRAVESAGAPSAEEGMAELETEPAVRAHLVVMFDEANGAVSWHDPLRRDLKEARETPVVCFDGKASRKRFHFMTAGNEVRRYDWPSFHRAARCL